MKSWSGRADPTRSAAGPLILIAVTAHADRTNPFHIPRGALATVLTQIALISGCGFAETVSMQALAGTAPAAEPDRSSRHGVQRPAHRAGYRIQHDALGFCFCSIFFRKPETTFRADALAVDARVSAAMHWANGEPAAGAAASDRGLVQVGSISDHRSSAHRAPGSAGDCGADDGASGLVRWEAE